MPGSEDRPSVTVTTLRRMKRDGDKISCLTAYDSSFARQLEDAGIDVVLVGDSLGMVVQGRESTVPVSIADMIYHMACVARGTRRMFRVVDMPFLSYATREQALGNAARLMREGGAQMVKLEGGRVIADTVAYLVQYGIPVCGHLGLLPQSVHKLGGYRIQGRDADSAQQILDDARLLDTAGAALLVLECIPEALAAEVTRSVSMPVIGIGAGPGCDGQVLVLYDMLGITPGRKPSFSRDFLSGADSVPQALAAYVDAVKTGAFP